MRKINQLSSRSALGLRLGVGISAAALVFTVVLPNAALARRGGELESSDDNRNRAAVRIDDDNDRRLNRNMNRGPGNGERCDVRTNLSNDGRRGRGRDENKIGSRSMHHIRGRSFIVPNNSLNSQRSIDDNEDDDAVFNDRRHGRSTTNCVRSTSNMRNNGTLKSNSGRDSEDGSRSGRRS